MRDYRRSTPGSFTCESLELRMMLTGVDCEPVITQTGDTIIAVGRAMDDNVVLTMGEQTHTLDFSGFVYTYDADEVTEIRLGGGFGNNTVRIVGSGLDDNGSAIGMNGTLTSNAYTVLTFSFQSTTIVGGGGNDYAQIYGSNAADNLSGLPEASVLTTPDSTLRAESFERVDAFGRGGTDYGQIYGTQQRDVLAATDNYVLMTGPGITKYANGFERVDSFGRGGNDTATLMDSATDDTFVSDPTFAYMNTAARLSYTRGFETVNMQSVLGGNDSAFFMDDASTTETFVAGDDTATLTGAGYTHTVTNFDSHEATSTGGGDVAQLTDLTTVDVVQTSATSTTVTGPGRDDTITGFATVTVPTEFEVFIDSLEPFLPQATVNALTQRIDTNRTSINGTAQADELVGNGAANEINAAAANDVVFAMGGADLVRGQTGNDSLFGLQGNDIVFGGAGNDQLMGGDASDILIGGAGNDIIDGESGDDYVAGGAGNDLYRFISLDDTIVISDFDINQDRIELINIDPLDIALGQQFGSLTINHPEGLNIVLLGMSPAMTIGDLTVDFVTGETQTIFDPDA